MQEIDSRIDTIRHRLGSIPEAAQIAELGARRTAVANALRDLRVEVDDLTAEQKKADRDVESVRARRERDQGLIDSGAVGSPKDIERMLHELQSLSRRISDLEDVELEVMERLEAAQQSLRDRTDELARIEEERERLEGARSSRAGELDGELAQSVAERKVTADGVPDDLLALYEKLREQKGGVGAAALRARQCGGCRLTLDNSILGEIRTRPTDDVVRCEECGRILVRTGESGL
ncbi:zinc ribbon domain-containing protein [Nocardioides terrisoli]|uniref:zinc ribbon domain-containing protein n=1 Tax=Nocardioides terrisoli TaxID=3388267 RepID=UPI00287BC1F0|nr:C4-type zinc ribbon domain-containing protein [Nocardioides marmorisolisilvae]